MEPGTHILMAALPFAYADVTSGYPGKKFNSRLRFAGALEQAQALLAAGTVEFAGLAEFYRPGADVVDRGAATGLFGVPTAMRVRACYFSRGKSLFGVVSTFFAAVEFVVSVGDRFAVVETPFPVPEFPGTRGVGGGLEAFSRLTDAARAELLARGAAYEAMAGGGSSFVAYGPGSFTPSLRKGGFGGGSAVSAARGQGSSGRFMVDTGAAWVRGVHCARGAGGAAAEAVEGTLKLVAQRARSGGGGAGGGGADHYTAGGAAAAVAEEESLELLLLPGPLWEDLRCRTWPALAGFSFSAKAWGTVLVAGLQKVCCGASLRLPRPS